MFKGSKYAFTYFIILTYLSFISSGSATETYDNSIDPDIFIQHYNNADCCLFIDKMDSIDLEDGNTLVIDFMAENNLLELSTGPTFAKLIKLKNIKGEKEYRIRAEIIINNEKRYAFIPFVALLDQGRNLKGTTSFSRISYQPGYFLNLDTYLYFNFTVDGNDPDSEYVLIYTRPKYFTKLDPDVLRQSARKIQAEEVPINMNKVKGEYAIESDTIYGLPASKITIAPFSKWFN